MAELSIQAGEPYPLGATWDGAGVNFAVFSFHAHAVELCLFDSANATFESQRLMLPGHTDQVFHGRVEGLAPGQLYGFRVYGEFHPHGGHRFNPKKVLFDPYAKAVGRDVIWDDSLFGFPAKDLKVLPDGDVNAKDSRDSAPFAPRAAVLDPSFDWGDDLPPKIPMSDSVVYETHVKGFTQLHPDVPEELRGTYAGMATEPAIRHLKSLGVTAVELLPIHYHLDEPHLRDRGLANYWGYNTLGFFAPQHTYAAASDPQGVVDEFKSMVKALHAAGLEVWLDVVYNHTAEGNQHGPTLMFRGIDNRAYYRLRHNDLSRYINITGTGNTVDLREARAIQLVMDSLRYWVQEMHVDGFRFDLCSVLGRESDNFDRGAGFFDAVRQDPALQHVKLVAEPWDLGIGGYQVGGYPTGWSEWNGKYRDQIRQFWKGDAGKLGAMATRVAGSSDFYFHSGRAPTAGVNFITAHDGFTLADLVAYNRKHNMANGEFNRDGESHNNSWNHGEEGPTDDPDIVALRERQKRNLLATLLLSAGTPMLSHGDELGRTQGGNNNAYCQDNEVSWIDWQNRDEDLIAFVRRLLRIRREQPQVRRKTFFTGSHMTFLPDISWYRSSGVPMGPEDWSHPELRVLGVLFGPEPQPHQDADPFLLLINASDAAVNFKLPQIQQPRSWARLFDTGLPGAGVEEPWGDAAYPLIRRSSAALRLSVR